MPAPCHITGISGHYQDLELSAVSMLAGFLCRGAEISVVGDGLVNSPPRLRGCREWYSDEQEKELRKVTRKEVLTVRHGGF